MQCMKVRASVEIMPSSGENQPQWCQT